MVAFNSKKTIQCIICFSVVMVIQSRLFASPVDTAIKALANRLEAKQTKIGENKGTWHGETDFTGSITVGMVDACSCIGLSSYWECAELAGHYILGASGGNFYADEALALMRLSEFAQDPYDNVWRTAVSNFYSEIHSSALGTLGYISFYSGLEPSIVVLCLAEHVVSAHKVGAEDVEIWRQSLLDWLPSIDDSCYFPVLSLGAATWALAQTGPLDETLIDPLKTGTSYWSLRKLEDLPALLLSHQVPSEEPMAGSFYWRFDHHNVGSEIPACGYTEDAIFATLGLIAAYQANPTQENLDLESAIGAARIALLKGISPEGVVREHLSQEGLIYFVYAGEMLQVLSELNILGDNDLVVAQTVSSK